MRGPTATAELTRQVIFLLPEGVAHSSLWARAACGQALCRSTMMARRTSSRTGTRRMRKKSWRCSTSPSTISNTLACVPGASAVTTWEGVGLQFLAVHVAVGKPVRCNDRYRVRDSAVSSSSSMMSVGGGTVAAGGRRFAAAFRPGLGAHHTGDEPM